MEAAKHIVKNTSFLYAEMAITVFISLYTTRLILSALGTKDFGTFNVVGGAIAMLTFLNNAMAAASQRFISHAQGKGDIEKQKSIFTVSILLHFLIGIALILVLESSTYFLFRRILNIDPHRLFAAKLIYQFMIASIFFTIISVPYNAVINAHENMLLVAILGVIEAMLKLSIGLYLLKTDFDKLITYGLLMALLSILLLTIRRIYCHRKYEEVHIKIKLYFDKILFREMANFAGWNLLGTSAGVIAGNGAPIMLNHFFGTALNAANGISNQLNGQLLAFSNTMLQALNPFITKSEGSG